MVWRFSFQLLKDLALSVLWQMSATCKPVIISPHLYQWFS